MKISRVKPARSVAGWRRTRSLPRRSSRTCGSSVPAGRRLCRALERRALRPRGRWGAAGVGYSRKGASRRPARLGPGDRCLGQDAGACQVRRPPGPRRARSRSLRGGACAVRRHSVPRRGRRWFLSDRRCAGRRHSGGPAASGRASRNRGRDTPTPAQRGAVSARNASADGWPGAVPASRCCRRSCSDCTSGLTSDRPLGA